MNLNLQIKTKMKQQNEVAFRQNPFPFIKKLAKQAVYLLIVFFLANSSAKAQEIDTFLMSVEVFKTENEMVSLLTRQQIARFLSSEMAEYVTPVLNIEGKDRLVELRTEYQDEKQSDLAEPSRKYPNYICDGSITDDFIDVSIIRHQDEEVLLSLLLERKKNKGLQKEIKQLAHRLVDAFIEKTYGINLNNRTKLSFRVASGIELVQPAITRYQKQLEVDDNARVLDVYARSSPDSPLQQKTLILRPRAFQFVGLRKTKNGIQVKRLKNSLTARSAFFLNDNYLGQLYELSFKREIGGNFSLGLAYARAQLNYEHSLSTFTGVAPIITKEEAFFNSYSLLLNYEHFFSRSNIILSTELAASLTLKGGHLQSTISWANLPFLGFELGFRNYALDIDRYQFEPFQTKAERLTQEERFLFLTLGLRLQYVF